MTTWWNEAGARLRPALVAFALLWACDDGGGDLQDNTPPAVAQVTVSAPATSIAVGETLQLQAVALDAEGDSLDDRTVAWPARARPSPQCPSPGRSPD